MKPLIALVVCVALNFGVTAQSVCGAFSRLTWSPLPSADETAGILVVDMRVVVDTHFFELHGRNSFSLVHDLIDETSSLFERALGIHLRIVDTLIISSGDPLGQITDATLLLERIAELGLQGDADLVHVFTGRDLDGEIFGISWMGSICSPPYAVSITQDLPRVSQLVATAHEIAHTLGARHDGVGYCGSELPGNIMWPILDRDAVSFSDCTTRLIDLTIPISRCLAARRESRWLPRRRP